MTSLKDYAKMPNGNDSLPLVSLVFPFEQKMNKKSGLLDMLTLAADKAERELNTKYPLERVKPVIIKLRKLIAGIHWRQDNKSMCILVSPLTEKVYYFTPTKQLSNNFLSPLINKL